MPELIFKGKEFVYNHHLSVPFRPLVPQIEKSIGEGRFDGNLIIQGDNLHALKALLPMYAGKVDVIYIDPPYNTGKEGWCYNDNVNSPIIREWLDNNPVGIEDGLRHDKWLAMMWPRLRFLRELLADHGVIFVSIDDHESHRLQLMMDEIFGVENDLGRIVVRLNPKGRHLDQFFAKTHEYVLVFAKDLRFVDLCGIAKDERMLAEYSEEDENGKFRPIELRNRNSAFNLQTRPNLYFPIYIDPSSGKISLEKSPIFAEEALPNDSSGSSTCWTWSPQKVERDKDLLIGRKTNKGEWRVFRKDYLLADDGKEATTKSKTIWLDSDLNMDLARKTVNEILGKNAFDFPKPVGLIHRLLDLISNPEALVLDSFAGSGTTAHSVLSANQKDGGNRKFILVECEDYAYNLTAERIRRVINGYKFEGSQSEELMRVKLNLTSLKKSDTLLAQVDSIENREGPRFSRIKKEVRDGELIVIGEKDVEERAEGLGGSFTFCTLGEPIELDRILAGENLPSFESLGSVLFHMATSQAFDSKQLIYKDGCGYLGESSDLHVWLIYKPDLEFLKSPEAALTLSKAKEFASQKRDKRHIVFAPARFVSRKILDENNLPLDFAPLPFALYRISPSDILS